MSNILVYALHYEGAFNKNSLGAVSEASRLAGELGGEAHAVVVGEGISDELAATLGKYGAKKVIKAEGPEGLAGPVIGVLGKLFDDGGYEYAIFGGGLLGFEIGAGLAARIDAGVTMEVTGVNVDGGKLAAERPILGDSSISTSRYKGKGIIIARLNAFEAKETGSDAPVENISVELSPQAQQATIVTRGEQRGADVDIEGASILVAGGRGLGKAEGFQLCDDLAKAFGGNSAVAATRAVVDAGWYPYAAQIGQTGKTVAPKLYLAAGISGAIQHKVGMQASENIVAINKDANAPIFEFSDLGIVGDLNKILPKLTEAVKARKG
ncbi:MAG TPA: electron transfer flavoprotein subunit alpha/FixB family protein [Baekduia sp.]|uniref:electron transfer flavoprotein subunit alpha/FixB family protein n=1 Tax=Baekduia sp. TaxID=2600305 RepID=UPI002D791662|nr:electron transfer flavoprotein subunit alpha/FixB family protein [Baekduia sp.]HET6506673.1 electron transfer flavoprotein subunit alpha/FixB family protein [Baekduia sp.]